MNNTEPKNSKKPGIVRRVVTGCGVGLIILCLIGGIFSALGKQTQSGNVAPTNAGPIATSQGADSVVISTWTPTVDTPNLTFTPIPQPTKATRSEIIAVIPGLLPVDVTLNLEQRQFTCSEVKQVVYYERTCKMEKPGVYLFNVDIVGREPFIVDYIDTTVLQFANPDNRIAVPVMGFVATMPYDNATPEEARAWVETTIPLLTGEPGDARETVFGGVKYVLTGSSTAISLIMGDLPPMP